MSSKVVISSRFICHLFHTLRLPLCATTPHWTLILSHTYSYTLSHLYNPAFLQLSRTKSSKVQSKLPPSREDFFNTLTGLIERLKMQWAASWLCIAAPLFLLCFAPSCPSAQKYPKCWHDRRTQIRQKQHSRKTFCDPSFSNQTAGAVTQVMQLLFGLSVTHCVFPSYFLYYCLLLHYVQWEKTRSRNLSDSVFVIWAYKATINSCAVTIRHEFCYVPDILSSPDLYLDI